MMAAIIEAREQRHRSGEEECRQIRTCLFALHSFKASSSSSPLASFKSGVLKPSVNEP